MKYADKPSVPININNYHFTRGGSYMPLSILEVRQDNSIVYCNTNLYIRWDEIGKAYSLSTDLDVPIYDIVVSLTPEQVYGV